jgi:hypothetical protein
MPAHYGGDRTTDGFVHPVVTVVLEADIWPGDDTQSSTDTG